MDGLGSNGRAAFAPPPPLKYHICKIKCIWSILYLYGLYHLQHKFSNYTELCFPIKWEGTDIDFFYIYNTLFIYPGLSNVLHILGRSWWFLQNILTYIMIIILNIRIKHVYIYNQNLLLFVMYVCMCLNKLALSFVSNIDVPCKIIFSVLLSCVLWTFTVTPMCWSRQPNCLIRVPLMAV